MKSFRDHLREVHARQYRGTDDDMAEDFEDWVAEDVWEIINGVAIYLEEVRRETPSQLVGEGQCDHRIIGIESPLFLGKCRICGRYVLGDEI